MGATVSEAALSLFKATGAEVVEGFNASALGEEGSLGATPLIVLEEMAFGKAVDGTWMVPDPGGEERGVDAVVSAGSKEAAGVALMGGVLETAAAASAMAAVSDAKEGVVCCAANSDSAAMERSTDITINTRKRPRKNFFARVYVGEDFMVYSE